MSMRVLIYRQAQIKVMELAPKDSICTLVSRGSLQEERKDLRSQREGEEG